MGVNPSVAAMDDSVLKHMSYDFIQIRQQQTVGEALAQVRQNPTVGRVIYFYVVDDDGRLCGVVPTRRLLLSALETPMSEIMVRQVFTILESATVLEACELFTMHRLLAFPIVDHKKRIVGIVDIDLYTKGRSELEESERSDDLFQLIGVHLAESEQANPLIAFRSRFPWLLCNIAAGIMAAFISGVFEDELQRVVALAMFVPVVLGLAESVSIQSVSLALQILHGHPPTMAVLWTKLRRELLTGLSLGLLSAAMVAVVALVWLRDERLSLCLLVGITSGVAAAAAIGMLMPNILRMLRRNPQVAAGPIALAAADMVTLLVYFSMARWIT